MNIQKHPKRKPSDTARLQLLALAILLLFSTPAFSQSNPPLVIAFAAPNSVTDVTHYTNFVSNELPYISGIGVTIHWADVDDCGTPAGSSPCIGQDINDDSNCPNHAGYYDWCNVDANLLQYINSGSFTGKKIVLIIWGAPEPDPATNTITPSYVFKSGPPQDVVVCGDWQGNVTSTSCPIELVSPHTTIEHGEYGIWSVSAGINSCTTSPLASSIKCNATSSCTSSPFTNFSGFPVVYEQQYINNYQNFLRALATHYSVSTGSHNGAKIGPYIAYVRVGMASGGENQAYCTTKGYLSQVSSSWATNTIFPAGYVVYTGQPSITQYVATGTGRSGAAMPTCAPAGCTTGPDGTIPGWYNAGTYTFVLPATNNAIWPGINGLATEPNLYSDNGYLSYWPPATGPSDGMGYTALMLSFLRGLGASFPFTISSHNGPPANNANSYADSEAIQASLNGVGFGMEALSIADAQLFAAAGGSAPQFPSSLDDWIHNFKSYPAPVYPLQTFYPGNLNSTNKVNRATGFPIASISATSGIVTVNCVSDCIPFANPTETPIYISGSPNPLFNGVWTACPVSTLLSPPPCTSGVSGSLSYLQFQPTPSIPDTPSTDGGIVWAPDYFPIIIPFAVQHGATSIELYECDLDYAYGAYAFGSSSQPTTTNWVLASSGMPGCVIPVQVPPTSGIITPVSGPDQSYKDAIALSGPRFTSILTGKSVLVYGSQY